MQPGLGCLRRGPVGVVSEVQEGMARSQRRGYSWGFRVFQLHIFNLRGGGLDQESVVKAGDEGSNHRPNRRLARRLARGSERAGAGAGRATDSSAHQPHGRSSKWARAQSSHAVTLHI